MKKVINSKPLILIFSALAVLAPIFNFSSRIGYVFVDEMTYQGFNYHVLIFMLINAVFLLVYAYVRFRNLNVKIPTLLYYISSALAVIFLILDSVYIIMSPDDFKVYMTYFIKLLPYVTIILGTLFLVFVFPYLKRNVRKVLSVVIIAAILLAVLLPSLGLFVFKFSSEPLVLDNGANYQVVWATNDKSTGYIEYSYGGEEYRVYDSESGRIVSSRIHRVSVPYEHLNSNTYSVHSQRVIDELSYGGTLGKIISSKEYNFKGEIKDDMNIIALSDWHTEVKEMVMAVSILDAPDLVIMLGDAADGYNHINDVIKYIISAGAKVTGSEVPAIFVRGNHDSRGEPVTHLGYMLGIDSFYYQIERGKYSFLVLDTGEDKIDSHPEYGGLADYENYIKKQLLWLESLAPMDTKYTFTLAHDGNYNYNEDMSVKMNAEVIRMNTNLLLCGHSHTPRLRDREFYYSLNVGGKNKKKEGMFNKVFYMATQLTISDGTAIITSIDQYGNIVLEETFIFN